jgi:DNA-directed RNA polymerase subunit E'/Rpb7
MTSPYISAVLQTKVMLHPDSLNGNLYANTKENLKKAVLNKCNESGCVVDIFSMNILDSECRAENMDGDCDTEVIYSCKLCCPQVGQFIVFKLIKYTKPFLVASNGPITSIIRSDKITLKNFNIEGEDVVDIASGKVLKSGDLVKLKILNVVFSTGGETILTTASLESLPDSSEESIYNIDTGAEKVTSSFVETSKVNIGLVEPGKDFNEIH